MLCPLMHLFAGTCLPDWTAIASMSLDAERGCFELERHLFQEKVPHESDNDT